MFLKSCVVVSRSMVWPCCLQRLHVEGVGEVRQAGSAWNLKGRKLELLDEEGNIIYQISIPCVLSSCFGTPVDFRLLDCNGEEVMPQRSNRSMSVRGSLCSPVLKGKDRYSGYACRGGIGMS
jgi:hypothetical protein